MRKLFLFLISVTILTSTSHIRVMAACGDPGTLGACGAASQCNPAIDADGLVYCCSGTGSCTTTTPCSADSGNPFDAVCPSGYTCCSGGCQSGSSCNPAEVPSSDNLTCGSSDSELVNGIQADCADGYLCLPTGSGSYSCQLEEPFIDWFRPIPRRTYVPPKIDSLEALIGPLVGILFWGGLGLGMIFILYAGYTLMFSEGNPQKTKDGQDQLTSALLGTLFVLLSATILRVIIQSLFNVTI